MTHRILTLIATLTAFAAPALAEVVPLSPTMAFDDGPWVDVAEGVAYDAAPLSWDDIVAMANLDGDPAVITAQEQAMIAMLSQVLGTSPIAN